MWPTKFFGARNLSFLTIHVAINFARLLENLFGPSYEYDYVAMR